MQLTETHQIRPNHKLYSICDELCFKSKNLYNAALFEFRQSFFDKELNTLTWQNINRIFNQSNQFDYRELPSKVSNTVLKKLGNNLSSFWSLVKKADYNKKVSPQNIYIKQMVDLLLNLINRLFQIKEMKIIT